MWTDHGCYSSLLEILRKFQDLKENIQRESEVERDCTAISLLSDGGYTQLCIGGKGWYLHAVTRHGSQHTENDFEILL